MASSKRVSVFHPLRGPAFTTTIFLDMTCSFGLKWRSLHGSFRVSVCGAVRIGARGALALAPPLPQLHPECASHQPRLSLPAHYFAPIVLLLMEAGPFAVVPDLMSPYRPSATSITHRCSLWPLARCYPWLGTARFRLLPAAAFGLMLSADVSLEFPLRVSTCS